MSFNGKPASVALRADRVGKRYSIGTRAQHDTLRDALASWWKPADNGADASEFWALKDVSFSISQGDVVGIIGRNGAGKSTLLKLLTRVTTPTNGRIEGYGRVGSLLEVGTGFHPELTGRDNVYLSGAILGMKRSEIHRKFDDIAAFAEIGQFLDTPVKRYSSGMFVRLGFAVAVHLQPDILVIDEVLSVGDAAFQHRCLEKMREIAVSGCTILFVSHNMNSVRSLCQRALWLDSGQLKADDSADKLVTQYLAALDVDADQPLSERTNRRGSGEVRLTKIRLVGPMPGSGPIAGGSLHAVFETSGFRPGLSCSFTVYDPFGQPVTYFDSAVYGDGDSFSNGSTQLVCEIDELLFRPGRYRINAALQCNGQLFDHVEGAAYFDVEPAKLRGRASDAQGAYGSIQLPHRWNRPQCESNR